MLNVFTSARVGEYIESTAREGTGRGLYYKIRDSHTTTTSASDS